MKNEDDEDMLTARSGTSAGRGDADLRALAHWEPSMGEPTGLSIRHVPERLAVGGWSKK